MDKLMVVTSDNFCFSAETHSALVAMNVFALVLVRVLEFFDVSWTELVRLDFHVAVVENKSFYIRQVLDTFKFFHAVLSPDRVENHKIFRNETLEQELFGQLVVLRVKVELHFREAHGERDPHNHLVVVFDFAGSVDAHRADVAVSELLGEASEHVVTVVAKAPRVLGVVEHLAGMDAVAVTAVARRLARLAVLARALDVLELAAQALVRVVAHQGRPDGDLADLRVTLGLELVLDSVWVELERLDTLRRSHNVVDVVENLSHNGYSLVP